VLVGGWNVVPTSNNIVIYSGGVYVLWEMYGVGITLARDITPPISYRTFEYVSGIWSEYRINQAEDFLIAMTLQKTAIEDVGTPSIVSPINNSIITASTPVTCWIKNFGNQTESVFNVHYQQWGSSIVTQAYSGTPILVGDSVQFTFTTPLAAGVGYTGSFCVWTTKTNDADMSNDSSCITLQTITSIENYSNTGNVIVYPNPMTNQSVISFTNPDHSPYQFMLRNAMGQLIMRKENITDDQFVIDRGKLPAGIYFIELKGKMLFNKKLMIE
jgi:hypothetical protein